MVDVMRVAASGWYCCMFTVVNMLMRPVIADSADAQAQGSNVRSAVIGPPRAVYFHRPSGIIPSIPARSAASASRRDSSHVTFGRVSASDMLVPRATFAQNTASFSRLRGSRIGLRSGGTGSPGAPAPWRCGHGLILLGVSARHTGCAVWSPPR